MNFGAPFGVNASQPNGQVMMATNDGFYVKARPAFVEFNSLNGNITVYYRHPGFSPTENRTVEEGKKVYSTILKEPEGGWGADNSSSAQTYNYKSLPYLMLTQNDWQGQDHPCLDTAEYCMQLCGLILQANMSDDWGLGNHATSEV